tara:strand:- start:805 stop:2781 length:1977 start_codon:yes stop_codon:yes gene_type:complete
MIKLNYRTEIDGLRAIAIIGVILYHAEFLLLDQKIFTGGYIGVDIFFVISGYLITSIIFKELKKTQEFSFKNFFFRRAKRILPALFFMIFASIFFAWIYLTPKNFIEYSNSIISSIFFYSNYFFYFQDLIYNSEDSLLKPLLHTWSLAVEEQFYIIFPVFIIIFYELIKNQLIKFFLILIFIFFLISLSFTVFNPALSFFASFSRFWEILLGSLLAVIELENKTLKFKFSNFLPYAGILLIFSSLIFFDKNTFHPSYLTLIPVLGIFFIINYIESNQFIYKFLNLKILSKIGIWSYSLYLWHYPIFAIARNRGKELSEFDKIELIILTLVFSLISYYLIEKPFRKIEFKKIYILIFPLLMFSIAFVYFNNLSKNTNGFEYRVNVILKNLARENLWEKNQDKNGFCFDRVKDYCNFYQKNEKSIIIIGDSQMEVVASDLKNKVNDFNFITINRAGCIYLPDVKKLYKNSTKEKENCTLSSKDHINEIIFSKKNSIIIIGGELTKHLTENNNLYDYKSINDLNIIDNFVSGLKKMLDHNHVILIYPIPSFKFDVTKRIMSEIPKGTLNSAEYLNKNPFFSDYNEYLKKHNIVINKLENIYHNNLHRIYPDEIFCDKISNKCFANKGNNIFYSDTTHLSSIGVEKLNRVILLKIKDINLSY